MDHNWIFTKSEQVSKDMAKTKRNRNAIIIGRPGSGKSRYYLLPNLLHANGETLIITDPKEELLQSCGKFLEEKGYDIKVFNLRDKLKSDRYNPMSYVHFQSAQHKPSKSHNLGIENSREKAWNRAEKTPGQKDSIMITQNASQRPLLEPLQDEVLALIHTLISNTQKEEAKTTDPFWQQAEMVFLQALFYYVLSNLPKEQQTISKVLELVRMALPKNGKSPLNELFKEWEERDPDNIGVLQWKQFWICSGSEKMLSSIVMMASARLASFNLKEINYLTSQDNMELDRIGRPRDFVDSMGRRKDGQIAYFIVSSANDSSAHFLASLLYHQIFSQIEANAALYGGRLPTPVTFYLDEFRQIGYIPHFLENLAYVRGLNVGISILLQSLAQLQKIYEKEWETVLDCCDYQLFLGSQSKETLDYLSKMLGKQTLFVKNDSFSGNRGVKSTISWNSYGRDLASMDELARMDQGFGILRIAGYKPFYSKLYELEKDPCYRYLFNPSIFQKGISNPEFRHSKTYQKNERRAWQKKESQKRVQNNISLKDLRKE